MNAGAEFSPEQYLPQPEFPLKEQIRYQENVTRAILTTTVCIEDIADEVLREFSTYSELPALPYGKVKKVEQLFFVHGGKSSGESNYLAGSCPYISSGDPQNSIVRLVNDVESEVFADGGITVTCFGQASVQPWRFMARGNGGSAVRVLIPKYHMSYRELVWFAAQINMQRWRFFYGRMAIQKRIRNLELKVPDRCMPDGKVSIIDRIGELSDKMNDIMNQ